MNTRSCAHLTQLSILFWFYKDSAVCINRLRLLRKYNPQIPIYGLYGGNSEEAPRFKTALGPYLDDFFHYTTPASEQWKWENGDLMIAAWYRNRGQFLPWRTLVVVQWDMLIFDYIEKVFEELKEGEILLSSVRPLSEVASWWACMRRDGSSIVSRPMPSCLASPSVGHNGFSAGGPKSLPRSAFVVGRRC